jgi:hypothetical protein
MMNTLFLEEEWTWFPDGDESRATTRVFIGTNRRDLESSTLWSLQILLAEVCQFIEEKEGGFDSAKIKVYGRSAFRDHVVFMYERPATQEEVKAEKESQETAVADRIADLREQIAKLEEK